MPWMMQKEGEQTCVHKKMEDGSAGEKVQCFMSEKEAEDHMAALYANMESEMKAGVVAVKATTEGWEISILGVPFGGPYKGKDKDGEFFSDKTNIHQDEFPSVPIVFAHGLDPESGRPMNPQYIGTATYSHKDNRGHWYKAILNKASEFAKKVWDAAQKGVAGASSGSIAYLTRRSKNGHIDEWPVVEVSVMDVTGGVVPRNPYAVVMPALKAEYEQAGIKTNLFDSGAGEASQPTNQNIPIKGTTMTDEEKKAKEEAEKLEAEQKRLASIKASPVGLVAEVLSNVQAQVEAQNAAKAANDLQRQELTEMVTSLVTSAMKAEPADESKKGGFATNLNLKTGRGDSEEKAFWYYMRTGDKKATVILNEGDDESGGALVPTGFDARIREKRDEFAIARMAGTDIIQTSLKTVNVPVEGTAEANPVVTNESAAATAVSYNQNEVEGFDTVPITVLKYTRLHRISEELVNDQKSNLEEFLAKRVGRRFGVLENALDFTAATATSALYGSGAGATSAAGTTVAVGDLWNLYYSLSQAWREGAIFVMNPLTEAMIRKLEGNPFLFGPTPQGTVNSTGIGTLCGNNRVFNTAAVLVAAVNVKSILFANMQGYTIAENGGFTVKRLNERFADTGEIGFLFSMRRGGAVNQAESLKHLLQESA